MYVFLIFQITHETYQISFAVYSLDFMATSEAQYIGIASSNQVQRQQQRDEPVRKNTHLVLDTLASRLRKLSLDYRS